MRRGTPAARAGFLIVAAGFLLGLFDAGHANDDDVTLLVVKVTPHFGADRAGIKAGDILTGWSSGDATREPERPQHAFAGPMDIFELEREHHPVTGVTLHGLRDGQAFAVVPGNGRWRLDAKPVWPDSIDVLYEELSAAFKDGDIDKGVDLALDLAASLRTRGRDLDSAWVLWRAGAGASANRQFDRATEIYQIAVDTLDADKHPRELAVYKSIYGRSLMNGNHLAEARTALQEANEAERAISPDRLTIGRNLLLQALIAKRNGDLKETSELLNEALWLQERVAPQSFSVAQTLNQLGITSVGAGNLSRAEEYFSRALVIAEHLNPGGITSGGYLNGIAMARYLQGDLSGAEQFLGRAAEIKLRLEPGTNNASTVLHNLGLMKLERGNFRDAEALYLQALEINEKNSPKSLDAAATLNNLGSLALEQGDIAKAASYHRRSLEIKRELAPNSSDLVASLINLGNVLRQQGNLEAAEQHCLDARQLQQKIAADAQRNATAWSCLGAVAEARGDIDLAIERFEQAMLIHRNLAPNGAGVAEIATRLGGLALDRQQHALAEDYFIEAHAIVSRLAPGTFRAARALHGLAEVDWTRGDTDAAVRHFGEAIDALDAQDTLMSSSQESRAHARAQHQEIFQRFIELLVEVGEPQSAFDILERSRAKVLRELLAERELVFDADIPPELERERRMLARTYERKQAELFAATDEESIEALHQELNQIRQDRDDANRRIRAQAPGLADFDKPQLATFASARDSLQPGTAVLSFNVMEERTHLFVIASNGDLSVVTLEIGREEIAQLTNRLRLLIDAGRWDRTPAEPLQQLSGSAYQRLIAPAEDALSDAQRLLIVPDGALRLLPFPALRRANDRGEFEYVAQWKPTVLTDSLAVLAQLGSGESSGAGDAIIAFGNPDYSSVNGDRQSSATARDTNSASASLAALPWSKAEVDSIRQSYPGKTQAYFGGDATEARAKSIPDDARYVHFATHTIVDAIQPLDTAIVLSLPGQGTNDSENGYLQAWEVIEGLRINAELVVLSGCETALGTDYPGEGLIGLTRAFHYAGAASVMASLWRVDDRSTSQLMAVFYEALANRMSPADALRAAQLAMIEGNADSSGGFWQSLGRWFSAEKDSPQYAHPYHWAAFTVNGRGAEPTVTSVSLAEQEKHQRRE